MVQRAFPVRKTTETKNALCIEAAAMLDPSWISSQNQQKGLIANWNHCNDLQTDSRTLKTDNETNISLPVTIMWFYHNGEIRFTVGCSSITHKLSPNPTMTSLEQTAIHVLLNKFGWILIFWSVHKRIHCMPNLLVFAPWALSIHAAEHNRRVEEFQYLAFGWNTRPACSK